MPAQVQGNRLALIDTAVRMAPGQNMQVAGNAQFRWLVCLH
jgi:hypothetical protein